MEKEDKTFEITGAVEFKCPNCGKEKIKRTFYERKIAAHYKCSSCGFIGPN